LCPKRRARGPREIDPIPISAKVTLPIDTGPANGRLMSDPSTHSPISLGWHFWWNRTNRRIQSI
jgi:hypothetical protein